MKERQVCIKAQKRIFQVVPDNTISILWQIPQIAIITAAEILFSITGYEFSYSQSGPSMKSVVQALWILTTAVGDTLIITMVLIDFKDLALLSLVYAVMMLLVIFVFALLAVFYYEYRDISADENEYEFEEEDLGNHEDSALDNTQKQEPQKEQLGFNNLGYYKNSDDWSAKL
uniref:Uncharacterized protein n=1 Tax=Ditylenchus dipsaci TaxID=166011 RepID=A0A915CW32_9BILA